MTETSTRPPQRILVVDDEPGTVDVVRKWYRGRPFEILGAEDGPAGIRAASSDPPDLVLLDLTMPGPDGISVARQLKSDPRTAGIPIILLTACKDRNTKVQAFKAGADDYIIKPFDLEEMDARIQASLRRRKMMRGLESELEQVNASKEELEKLLMIDEKTGLYNFRAFQSHLQDEWQRAQRYQLPLSVIFFDLDHFKQLNDSMGHQAGDRALKEFATLVAGGARANDVAARYGGEEFAVILPHTDGAMATRVAARILDAVREFVFLEDETPQRITVSAGVATFPSGPHIDSMDALIRAADAALYQAKSAGRDRVVQDQSIRAGASG